MEKAGGGPKQIKLMDGVVLYSAYQAPSRQKNGYHWEATEWHIEQGYPYKWKLVKNETVESQPEKQISNSQSNKRATSWVGNANASWAEPKGDRD